MNADGPTKWGAPSAVSREISPIVCQPAVALHGGGKPGKKSVAGIVEGFGGEHFTHSGGVITHVRGIGSKLQYESVLCGELESAVRSGRYWVRDLKLQDEGSRHEEEPKERQHLKDVDLSAIR